MMSNMTSPPTQIDTRRPQSTSHRRIRPSPVEYPPPSKQPESPSSEERLPKSYSTTSRGTYNGTNKVAAYTPTSRRRGGSRHSGSTLDYSSRSDPLELPIGREVDLDRSMPDERRGRLYGTAHNDDADMPSVEWGDDEEEQILGTFCVPTFKGEEGRRSRQSRGDPSERRRRRRRKKGNVMMVDRTPPSRQKGKSLPLELEGDSCSEDGWMEEALLHGISVANEEIPVTTVNVPQDEPLEGALDEKRMYRMDATEGGGYKSSDSEVLPRVSIQERRRSSTESRELNSNAARVSRRRSSRSSKEWDESEEIAITTVSAPLGEPLKATLDEQRRYRMDATEGGYNSSDSEVLPRVSIQQRRRSSRSNDSHNLHVDAARVSKRRSSSPKEWDEGLFSSHVNGRERGVAISEMEKAPPGTTTAGRSSLKKLHSTGLSSSKNRRQQKSARPRSTVAAPKDQIEAEPRRNTFANMADDDLAAYLVELTSASRKKTNLPPDALSNIPALPLVKTYKVIKQRPNEPAGLLLTKAKNGAVVVHSLSPESLFRGTDLAPGHEVLSVNEKRVNDPKMAATLITQARGGVTLRASGADRPRGFLYCQVKRKGEAVGAAHGLRFITTNTDGVKRGNPNSRGLVRVSAADADGLFAKSHPLNRLRVGSIVLTVNGAPITNGREALEIIMGSKRLVEVLHCDERVWREDWLWCSLEEADGGERKSPDELINLVFRKEEFAVSSDWILEWNSERDEVNLSKPGVDWAFKLLFNTGVGTCHCEEVDGHMLPPTDEFDVSLFVQLVNEKQQKIMQVLRNMLGRAKFEQQFGSTYTPPAEDRRAMRRRGNSACEKIADEEEIRSNAKYGRKMSYDAVQMVLMKDDGESVDEETCNLVNDLLRVDDRDRQRKRQQQGELTVGRRGSTGHIEAFTSSNFDVNDLEAWYLASMGDDVTNEDKLKLIHSRRKQLDERQTNKMLDKSTRSNASAYSMFSAGMLEELEDYIYRLGSESDTDPSLVTYQEDIQSEVSPKSPRIKKMDEQLISPKSTPDDKHSEMSSNQVEEKEDDEQGAYITGVFRDVATKYDISDVIVGSGGFGEVRECTDKKNGHTYVVKTINKPPLDDTSKINLIRNEILLLHEAKHQNIVELKDLFEDSRCVHIVMEKCTGGDLFDRVVNENPARIRHRAEAIKHETRTANTMRAIMQVIKYLHSKGIVHRDIKPEHFLLTTNKKESQRIKLIDFGLARKHQKGSPHMTTFTGSPSFVAPEVIARSYDHRCDLFSTGVTAYFLLTGMLPFDGPSDEDTFDLISIGQFRFPSSSIHLSDDARDFITKLLRTDPNKRMTADEALNHPWLKKDASC